MSPQGSKEQTSIVPVNTEMQFLDDFQKYTSTSEDDFFMVLGRGGKKKREPNARILQSWANKQKISTKIISVIKNDEFAQAIVRGWIGPKENPIITAEEAVTISYIDYEREWLINNLTPKFGNAPKAKYSAEYEKFVPANPEATIEVLKYICRKKMFGDREAVTKAQSRIYRKLLGAEWRDKEEQEAEAEEVATVQESIKEQKAGIPATEKQCKAIYAISKGDGSEDIVKGFLENHDAKKSEDLSIDEASELIDILKGGE